MHFIEKLAAPDFFLEQTEGKTHWDEYRAGKKQLREYILNNEQYHLCVYCERTISADAGESHAEHVQPKDLYPELTFDYSNLAVSCEGTQVDPTEMSGTNSTGHSCGHKKANEYDEALFLNPLRQLDIADYIVFQPQTQFIAAASESAKRQVEYTANILRLNESSLLIARKNAVISFRKTIVKLANKQQQKQAINRYLNDAHKPFISCLRYNFSRLAS